MVNIFLLLIIVIFVSVQQVTKKAYNLKVVGGAMSFSAASCVAAVLVFLITSGGKLNFSAEFLPYSLLFALSYSVTVVTGMLAIMSGPLSLTCLVTSFSLIIPTVYGIIVLQEPVSTNLFIGLGLLAVALVLINLEEKGEKKITLKWAIYVILAFVGNGMCSTVQKVQQIDLNGQYKSEFMIVALVISIVAMGVIALCAEKKQILPNLKAGFWLYTICGLANGVTNFLVIFLSSRMAASVMFPVISAGGIVLTFFISLFFYKEKLSKWQILGSALGLVSVIFLNL
jgi:drug/metabolite transporter (DMT)-like permease